MGTCLKYAKDVAKLFNVPMKSQRPSHSRHPPARLDGVVMETTGVKDKCNADMYKASFNFPFLDAIFSEFHMEETLSIWEPMAHRNKTSCPHRGSIVVDSTRSWKRKFSEFLVVYHRWNLDEISELWAEPGLEAPW